jgi:hypothetical protein
LTYILGLWTNDPPLDLETAKYPPKKFRVDIKMAVIGQVGQGATQRSSARSPSPGSRGRSPIIGGRGSSPSVGAKSPAVRVGRSSPSIRGNRSSNEVNTPSKKFRGRSSSHEASPSLATPRSHTRDSSPRAASPTRDVSPRAASPSRESSPRAASPARESSPEASSPSRGNSPTTKPMVIFRIF